MNRGFLDSGGRKNNHRKKTDTVTGTGSVIESDGTLNVATPLVDSVEKEVVSPSVYETMTKDKQTPTSLGSVPPLPTHETPSAGGGNGIDVVVPVDSIKAISERFVNTTCGFFLGKQVAYPIVANYYRNTWGEFGLVRSMFSSSTGLISFQFSFMEGLNAMLENGLWSIYARAMIELRADVELKDNIVVAMPKITREGYYTCNIRVEYEWKPTRCACCKVFGHDQEEYPKNIVYQPVSKKPTVNTSVDKKKNVEPTKEVSKSNPFEVLTSVENDVELVTLVDDDGKPLEKVASSCDYDSEDEVESAVNDMANFLAKNDGYGQDIPEKLQAFCNKLDITVR
ncbi:hypothetical protein Tco_1431714 [Tanacetum coccineum]